MLQNTHCVNLESKQIVSRGEVLEGEPGNCGMSQTLVATRLHPHDAHAVVAAGLDNCRIVPPSFHLLYRYNRLGSITSC